MVVNGRLDQGLAACIVDMLADASFPKLPQTDDPRARNREIVQQAKALPPRGAPIPFLLAMMKQESGLRHFNEPAVHDDDTYIVVGLDTNASEKHVITSRGYGVGQYTLFHHPPRPDEVSGVMADVGRNLAAAALELDNKFVSFVTGPTPGTQATDRLAEIGSGPLRRCKYAAADPRFLRDCARCAGDAGTRDIASGVTPLHANTQQAFEPTQYYAKASYVAVPRRESIGCDWPYAARRYNGSGLNSYHYQARILKNLLTF